MIKGHTEIQLYKDGKMVQNTHDDNMLTNALAGYFKNYGLLNPTPFGSDVYNDFITTLLGGVLLLDTALPEQASLTHVPGGVLMVGNGAYGVSNGSTPGDPTEMGSFNASQSGWADNNKTQFRMVWDFTTEQSNGTIACACLTSRAHGFMGEGNATSKVYRINDSYTVGTYSQSLGTPSINCKCYIDSAGYIYTIDGIHDNKYKIYRQKRPLASVDMRSVYDAQDEGTPWKEFEIPTSTVPADKQGDMRFCGSDANNIYTCYENNGVLYVATLPKALNTVIVNAYSQSDFPVLPENMGNYLWIVDGNNFYAIGGSEGWKFDRSTLAGTAIIYDAPFHDGRRWGWSDDGEKIRFADCIYDKTLNRVLKLNATGYAGAQQYAYGNIEHAFKESLFVDAGRNEPYYAPISGRRNDYIATINNLSTPVTKDNTQTMKVIYTLTFTG